MLINYWRRRTLELNRFFNSFNQFRSMAGSAHKCAFGRICAARSGCAHLSGQRKHRTAAKRIQSSLWCCWTDPSNTAGNSSAFANSNTVASLSQWFKGKSFELIWKFNSEHNWERNVNFERFPSKCKFHKLKCNFFSITNSTESNLHAADHELSVAT